MKRHADGGYFPPSVFFLNYKLHIFRTGDYQQSHMVNAWRKFVETDDDQVGCFGVLLRENPYSTKTAENVTGRQNSVYQLFGLMR